MGSPPPSQAGRYDLCCCCGVEPRGHTGSGLRLLRPFLSRFYTPVLLHRCVRPLVVSGAVGRGWIWGGCGVGMGGYGVAMGWVRGPTSSRRRLALKLFCSEQRALSSS